MSFKIENHRDEKTGDLVSKVTNAGGENIKKEYADMVAELMAIPNAEIIINFPSAASVEKQRTSSHSGTEESENHFRATINFDDQGTRGTVAVVTLKGSLVEKSEANTLKDTMLPVKTDAVLFDLAGVTRINDDGLGQFVSEWQRIRQEKRTVMVSGPISDAVDKQLGITKLGTVFNVFPDQKAALDWYGKEGPVKVVRQTAQPVEGLHA